MPIEKGFRISMDFDIIRYVLISLTYFGHNLDTSPYLDKAPRLEAATAVANEPLDDTKDRPRIA
jgi:hypothetical protein